MKLISLLVLALAASACHAQQDSPQLKPRVPKVVPVPPLPSGTRTIQREPTDPPARTVDDTRAHVSFHLPAGWNLSLQDGEISTFRLDARTAPRSSEVREAASLAFNPYPMSTFSGAIFYVTQSPHSSMAACAAETSQKPQKVMAPATIDDVAFTRGRDEHGKICTEARDVAYTAFRQGSCLRFDLVVNTFCGGDVSGAAEITVPQLENIFRRLEGILQTVKFTGRR